MKAAGESRATLDPVTRGNWVAVARVELAPGQAGLVAPCAMTLAEWNFEPHHELFAVCLDGAPVGLLACCPEIDPPDPDTWWIFRLTIDRRHQRRGHGRRALELAVAEIRRRGAKRILAMHKPENGASAALLESLGFRPVGWLEDGDRLLELLP